MAFGKMIDGINGDLKICLLIVIQGVIFVVELLVELNCVPGEPREKIPVERQSFPSSLITPCFQLSASTTFFSFGSFVSR